MTLAPDDPRHGKRRGYNLGCRCAPCREARRAYDAARYAANREETLARVGRRAVERAEEIRAYQARYRTANAERLSRYYEENRERRREASRRYDAEHPDRRRERVNRRRSRVVGARFEPYSVAEIIARDLPEGCYLCGLPFDPEDCHLDHIQPLFHGGTDTADNLAATHPACNLSKGAKPWPVVAWDPAAEIA